MKSILEEMRIGVCLYLFVFNKQFTGLNKYCYNTKMIHFKATSFITTS